MIFNYKALDPIGRRKEASVDALNVEEATESLKKGGLVVIKIDKVENKQLSLISVFVLVVLILLIAIVLYNVVIKIAES